MTLNRMPDLREISFQQAKEFAKAMSPATFKDLAISSGIPSSTLQRMFTDPEYDPSARNIPLLCEGLGNTIMVDWMASKIGGRVVLDTEQKPSQESLQVNVAKMMREASDVISADAEARMDGVYTVEELEQIEREANELINAAHSVRESARKRRLQMKMQEQNNG
ncbi:MAG: phage regulatory CII family protein [Deferribacterales bacterium]